MSDSASCTEGHIPIDVANLSERDFRLFRLAFFGGKLLVFMNANRMKFSKKINTLVGDR